MCANVSKARHCSCSYVLSDHLYGPLKRNTDDKDVIRFLKLFTDISMHEINKLSKLEGEEINDAKKILANELTKNTHGKAISEKVYNSALETFEKRVISENLPVKVLNPDDFSHGFGLLSILVEVGFASSNSDARKSIQNGAIRLNDQNIGDPSRIFLSLIHISEPTRPRLI